MAGEGAATQLIHVPCNAKSGGAGGPGAAQQHASPAGGGASGSGGRRLMPAVALVGAPVAYTRLEHLGTLGIELLEGPGLGRGGPDNLTTVKVGWAAPEEALACAGILIGSAAAGPSRAYAGSRGATWQGKGCRWLARHMRQPPANTHTHTHTHTHNHYNLLHFDATAPHAQRLRLCGSPYFPPSR